LKEVRSINNIIVEVDWTNEIIPQLSMLSIRNAEKNEGVILDPNDLERFIAELSSILVDRDIQRKIKRVKGGF